MMDKAAILNLLKTIQDPELKREIISLGMVKEIHVEESHVRIQLELTSSSPSLKDFFQKEINQKIKNQFANAQVEIDFMKAPGRPAGLSSKEPLPGIRHVVAVASGKGGVGKSTVAVNLALALAQAGHRVGLMDGDIYGPNVPLMLGVSNETRPSVNEEEKLLPIEAFGIKMISMGVLVPADQPMVWRGPMLHSAVSQFLQKVYWGELDFLLVDLPPGTGDVQLSLVQLTPLSGAVIVTTPQEVALMDVRKGVAMFRKTQVPILGVIENMSGEIFGHGGGEKAAQEFQVPFLGRVPLDSKVREGGDAGKPIVLLGGASAAAVALKQAAQQLTESLSQLAHHE